MRLPGAAVEEERRAAGVEAALDLPFYDGGER